MDICVINPFFYPYQGGTEKVLLEVYKRLAKRHNISVISAQPSGEKKTEIQHIHGIKVIRLSTRYMSLPMTPLPFMWMSGVQEHIRREGADVYHINNRYLYFGRTILAIKGIRKKLVLTIHNSLPKNIDFPTDLSGWLYDKAWSRRIMGLADAITAVSKDALDATVPKRYHPKSSVIYNGVDAKLYRPHSKSHPRVRKVLKKLGNPDILITNNGRLVPQKGQQYLIQAVSELKKEVQFEKRKVHLLLIGRGPMQEQLQDQADALGINFDVISGIPERELPYYYNASDIFVMPSLYEPAGAALMEAMACETPCIATRIGGMPEYLKNAGCYVRDRSPLDITEKIITAINDKRESAAMAQRGRKLMLKNHDWDKIAKQYEHVFTGLARR